MSEPIVPNTSAAVSQEADSAPRPGADHDCLDWNSGGACFICRRPLSIEEQTRGDVDLRW